MNENKYRVVANPAARLKRRRIERRRRLGMLPMVVLVVIGITLSTLALLNFLGRL